MTQRNAHTPPYARPASARTERGPEHVMGGGHSLSGCVACAPKSTCMRCNGQCVVRATPHRHPGCAHYKAPVRLGQVRRALCDLEWQASVRGRLPYVHIFSGPQRAQLLQGHEKANYTTCGSRVGSFNRHARSPCVHAHVLLRLRPQQSRFGISHIQTPPAPQH